jgi:hypothetical protein
MIAKCGQIRVWHWAHRAIRTCDPWWEPETKWHRDWKNQFPEDWQERIHKSEAGERHIADVKTDFGVVRRWLRTGPSFKLVCKALDRAQ